MALEFPGVTQIWDCRFENAYILDDSAPPGTLEVSKEGNNWWVKSSSSLQSMQGDLEWTRSGAVFDTMHSYGKLGYGKPVLGPHDITHVDVKAILSRCIQTNEKAEIYAETEGIAQFGPEYVSSLLLLRSFAYFNLFSFQRLNKVSINETEAICWIRGHVDEINRGDYVFHPAVMDAVFQVRVHKKDNKLPAYVFFSSTGSDRMGYCEFSICNCLRP
jgi:fatty acid synthase